MIQPTIPNSNDHLLLAEIYMPESPHELVLAVPPEEADEVPLATLPLDLVGHVGKVLEPVRGDHLRICRIVKGHDGVEYVGTHDARETHLLDDGGYQEVLDEGHAALN